MALHIPHAGDVPEGTTIKVSGPVVVVPNPSGFVRFDDSDAPTRDFLEARPKPGGAPGEWEFLHEDGEWRDIMPDLEG